MVGCILLSKTIGLLTIQVIVDHKQSDYFYYNYTSAEQINDLTPKSQPSDPVNKILLALLSTIFCLIIVFVLAFIVYVWLRKKRGASYTVSIEMNNNKTYSSLPIPSRPSSVQLNAYIIPFKELLVDYESPLGSGGFGEVWKGKWRGVDIAVKKINQAIITRTAVQAFMREAKIMQLSSHNLYLMLQKPSSSFQCYTVFWSL
jgi:hypothetical protein